MHPGRLVKITIAAPVGPIEKLINGKIAKVRRRGQYTNVGSDQLVVRMQPSGEDFHQPLDIKVDQAELILL